MRTVKKSKLARRPVSAARVRQKMDQELDQQIEQRSEQLPPPVRDPFVEMDPALRRPS